MENDQKPKSLYDRYTNTDPWEESVPSDLIPAIKSLREGFDKAHWNCGRITQILCFTQLHSNLPDEEARMYIKPLMQLKVAVGAAVTARFNDLLRWGTPSAIFKAFFDLYVEGVRVQALEIFDDLKDIGRANKATLGAPYLEWAQAQTQKMIRDHVYKIENWVCEACDKRVFDPAEDIEEPIWRKWKAPLLVIMKPARSRAYDAASVWERADAETSYQCLRSFAVDYVLHVESALQRAVGKAAVELAKQPKVEQPTGPNASQNGIPSSIPPNNGPPSPNGRREASKLEKKKMYESWRKEYRRLKKIRPEMSDNWHSQRIAGMDIAKGRSAETIRKHMVK